MYQKSTKEKAAANKCSAMECRNHSKNAVSLKNLMSRENIFALLVVTMLTLSSCTVTQTAFQPYQKINVKLDAMSSGENVTNKKVALMVCNDENIPKHDLKNIELESYIKKVLISKGYTFTDNNW